MKPAPRAHGSGIIVRIHALQAGNVKTIFHLMSRSQVNSGVDANALWQSAPPWRSVEPWRYAHPIRTTSNSFDPDQTYEVPFLEQISDPLAGKLAARLATTLPAGLRINGPNSFRPESFEAAP